MNGLCSEGCWQTFHLFEPVISLFSRPVAAMVREPASSPAPSSSVAHTVTKIAKHTLLRWSTSRRIKQKSQVCLVLWCQRKMPQRWTAGKRTRKACEGEYVCETESEEIGVRKERQRRWQRKTEDNRSRWDNQCVNWGLGRHLVHKVKTALSYSPSVSPYFLSLHVPTCCAVFAALHPFVNWYFYINPWQNKMLMS